jgi:serine/threonine protein kinase
MIPQRQYGKYDVISPIGEGKYARVYLGREHGVGGAADVALKVFKHELQLDINAIIKEFGWLLRFLPHPHIVRTYDAGEQNGDAYITMEFMEGSSLRGKIRAGNLHLDETLSIIQQIASALDALHKGNVVHRDVKPENILFTSEGTAKLGDFGYARTLRTGESYPSSLGTFGYMSPEVANKQGGNFNADVFSLGCVFYEMITGCPPYSFSANPYDDEDLQLANYCKSLSSPPRKPRQIRQGIPQEVERVILRAIDPDRDRRYQLIEDMTDELNKIQLDERGTIGTTSMAHGQHLRTDEFDALKGELARGMDSELATVQKEIEECRDFQKKQGLLTRKRTLDEDRNSISPFIDLVAGGRFLEVFDGGMRQAFAGAIRKSVALGNFYVGVEHLFLSLLESGGGALSAILASSSLSNEVIANEIASQVEFIRNNVQKAVTAVTPRLSEILKSALSGAGGRGLKEIDEQSFLHACFSDRMSVPVRCLVEHNIDIHKVLDAT